jgi:hypothetical protein
MLDQQIFFFAQTKLFRVKIYSCGKNLTKNFCVDKSMWTKQENGPTLKIVFWGFPAEYFQQAKNH